MNQEQYVEAMLKIAYHAGCEVARQEIEKEAQGGLPRPKIPAEANKMQARSRGPNPRSAQYVDNPPAGAPMPGSRIPVPRMTMGGRTPGVRTRKRQQVPSSVAGR